MSNLTEAKVKARQIIETQTAADARRRAGGATLRELCDDYLKMPLECRDYVAKQNIQYLAMIVREVLDKSLEEARVSDLRSSLWSEFARLRQGGGSLQYAVPVKCNAGINSAIRSALSIFAARLDEHYERLGHKIDLPRLRRFQWLKVPILPKKAEPRMLATKIRRLRKTNPRMWRALGLARFAGLRPTEVRCARRTWLERNRFGTTFVVVRHRPEENYLAKSDAPRRSIILDARLADFLWSLKGDEPLAPPPAGRSAEKWFDRDLNDWVRQFVPKEEARLAMHRLRGFYADETTVISETAIRERAIKATSQQLGHKSTLTTTAHYLSSI